MEMEKELGGDPRRNNLSFLLWVTCTIPNSLKKISGLIVSLIFCPLRIWPNKLQLYQGQVLPPAICCFHLLPYLVNQELLSLLGRLWHSPANIKIACRTSTEAGKTVGAPDQLRARQNLLSFPTPDLRLHAM